VRTEKTSLTQGLAAFTTGDASAIPPVALAAARRAIIDTVGVMLAGRIEAPIPMLSRTLGDGNEALSLATGRRLRAPDAALLDGLAGHVLDYDDVGPHGHPSVVIVPALLAEGQRIGASGEAILRAYVIGFETWAELAWRETDAYHMGSWHPTPALGIVATTAALASLHGLHQEAATHALALAASFAAGVIANFGTPIKPLQAGRAASGAIEAIRLAQAGIIGAPDAIDGAHGLLRGISPRGNVDTASPIRAGNGAWQLLEQGLSVKRYPVCYAAHRAIDGVLALARDMKPDQVRKITVSLGRAPAETLRYHAPTTGLEARFSLHHNLAAALVSGNVGFAQLTDDYVRRPDATALYSLTTMEIVNEECPEQPGMAKFDRVIIEAKDGRQLDSKPIRYPRGHARLPLSDDELDVKFLDCAHHCRVREAEKMLGKLRAIEKVKDLRELATWWATCLS
jgi:2-methylcitrate dehydratase PrpD